MVQQPPNVISCSILMQVQVRIHTKLVCAAVGADPATRLPMDTQLCNSATATQYHKLVPAWLTMSLVPYTVHGHLAAAFLAADPHVVSRHSQVRHTLYSV